jgi:hypothetical protein
MSGCVIEGVATIRCLVPLFANFTKAIVALGGIVLFIMLLVGGFNFLFSAGDPKKLEAARGTITQAIMGLAIMSIAYLIILTIQTFTGVNVTNFTIPNP